LQKHLRSLKSGYLAGLRCEDYVQKVCSSFLQVSFYVFYRSTFISEGISIEDYVAKASVFPQIRVVGRAQV